MGWWKNLVSWFRGFWRKPQKIGPRPTKSSTRYLQAKGRTLRECPVSGCDACPSEECPPDCPQCPAPAKPEKKITAARAKVTEGPVKPATVPVYDRRKDPASTKPVGTATVREDGSATIIFTEPIPDTEPSVPFPTFGQLPDALPGGIISDYKSDPPKPVTLSDTYGGAAAAAIHEAAASVPPAPPAPEPPAPSPPASDPPASNSDYGGSSGGSSDFGGGGDF